MINSVIVAEAIRNAQRITGKKQVTGEDVRRGFETLDHHATRAGRRWALKASRPR